MGDVTIYHNPDCGTSRNTLALIRNAGVEPTIIEYLKTPPSLAELTALIARAGLTVREAIRVKGTPFHELALDDPKLTDEQLLDAMLEHPILINRPFVVTPWGVVLSRPSERVLDVLPLPQKGLFKKEDGELVIDAAGNRVRAAVQVVKVSPSQKGGVGGLKMRKNMRSDPYNVLFLCTGNSARSIMAEAILNRAGQGNFRAFSAGSHPKGHIHAYVLDLLRKLHYDVTGLRSKSWKEFSRPDAPNLDFVFTVCDNAAKEACPLWPGQPMTAHWGVPDPVEATGSEAEVRFAFADTLRMLTNRINIFVSLPLQSLDQLTLQKQIDAIGKTRDAGGNPASAA